MLLMLHLGLEIKSMLKIVYQRYQKSSNTLFLKKIKFFYLIVRFLKVPRESHFYDSAQISIFAPCIRYLYRQIFEEKNHYFNEKIPAA